MPVRSLVLGGELEREVGEELLRGDDRQRERRVVDAVQPQEAGAGVAVEQRVARARRARSGRSGNSITSSVGTSTGPKRTLSNVTDMRGSPRSSSCRKLSSDSWTMFAPACSAAV